MPQWPGQFAKYNASRNPYDATKADIVRYCAHKLFMFEPKHLREMLLAEFPELQWSAQDVSNLLSRLMAKEELAMAPPQMVRRKGWPVTRSTRLYTGDPVAKPRRK